MPDRIQQEIEELLARLETFPPKRPLSTKIKSGISSFFRSIANAISSIPVPHLTAGHLLLIAIAMIVVAFMIGGGSDLVRWVIIGGFVLFIVAFVMSLRRHSRPEEKLWRGKPMDLNGPGVGERLRSWWRRRSRR
jgi:high-affinity Fe2+/Pb2+ permease